MEHSFEKVPENRREMERYSLTGHNSAEYNVEEQLLEDIIFYIYFMTPLFHYFKEGNTLLHLTLKL